MEMGAPTKRRRSNHGFDSHNEYQDRTRKKGLIEDTTSKLDEHPKGTIGETLSEGLSRVGQSRYRSGVTGVKLYKFRQ